MAKDAFMMSFYLRGILFHRLGTSQKSDLQDAYSITTQQDTSTNHRQMGTQMQALVDKYKHLTDNSPYLPFSSCESGWRKTPTTNSITMPSHASPTTSKNQTAVRHPRETHSSMLPAILGNSSKRTSPTHLSHQRGIGTRFRNHHTNLSPLHSDIRSDKLNAELLLN